MQTLDGKIANPSDTLATMIEATYTRYLNSSRSFIWFIFEPLATPEGEQCKNDFVVVVSAHIAEST